MLTMEVSIHYADKPVYEEYGKPRDDGWNGAGWYFWDETQTTRHGPFKDQYECRRKLLEYAANLNKPPAPVPQLWRVSFKDMTIAGETEEEVTNKAREYIQEGMVEFDSAYKVSDNHHVCPVCHGCLHCSKCTCNKEEQP